jgi:hypothetical protein
MPGAWTFLNIKDALGTTRPMRAWDESGTGGGDFAFAHVAMHPRQEDFVSGCISTSMTGTASTLLLAAPAAGLRNYISQITVSNSHATVGTDVLIQDGSGGSTLLVIPAAAVYGGAAIAFPTPLRQPTLATAIYAANATTGSSTKVSVSGYQGE